MQTPDPAQLPHVSQLDHLRPPPGWRTDYAVISTYSAHISVVGAALLALGGQVDESGSGTKIDFAKAVGALRGKVYFVVQSSRLTVAKKAVRVVSLLDRFVLQVPWNEGIEAQRPGKSWHAKFALVRHVPEAPGGAGERWTFMLGSRNLTHDLSWDIGLLLTVGEGVTARQELEYQLVPGIARLAIDLTGIFPKQLKRLPSFAKSLGKAQWGVPGGLTVSEIQLQLPDSPERRIPSPPKGVRRVLAVSPFLDTTAVAEVATWGGKDCPRQLLSTRMAIETVAGNVHHSLADFEELLVLPPADHEIVLGDPITAPEEQVPADQIGLHAKLLFVEHENGAALWLGSPNLTSRAWTRNAECYAQILLREPTSKAAKALRDGLQAFVNLAEPVSLQSISLDAKADPIQKALSLARNEIAAALALAMQGCGPENSLTVTCPVAPHPTSADVVLSCGPLIGTPLVWERRERVLTIAGAAGHLNRSDFLKVRIAIGEAHLEWLQIVPWDPPLDDERDGAVLSEYLGPRQLSSWIHSALSGYANGDEGGPWDNDDDEPSPKSKPQAKKRGATLGLPTIDQALRTWLRNRSQLDEVDRILQVWQRRRSDSALPPSDDDKSVDEHLVRFSESWAALRKVLHKALK